MLSPRGPERAAELRESVSDVADSPIRVQRGSDCSQARGVWPVLWAKAREKALAL